MLVALLFAWLLPQEASAMYVDETYNYQVMLSGASTIRIKVPVYDQEGEDTYILNGYLNMTWKDKDGKEHSNQTTVLHWGRSSSIAQKESSVGINFRTYVDGSLIITQGNSSSQFTLTKSDNQVTKTVYRNSDTHSYDVSIEWRLPFEMMGSTITFTWDVDRTGVGTRKHEKVSGLSSSTITVPPATATVYPQVTMAMMSFQKPGIIEVPWFMASDNIKSAKYVYVDHDGNTIEQNIDVQKNGTSIELDATEPHKNFRVVVDYTNNQGFEIKGISSDPQNLKMIHVPVGLSACPLGDKKASVRLNWSILYPEAEDLSSQDAFEIQRSLTGKEEDFETIFSEPYVFDPDESTYTFIDSTLVEAIVRQHLKQGGTLDSLTYRVRRSMTESWGWNHVYAPRARCVVDDIHLLRIATYSAKWEDERAFTARVDWEYANEYNSVWDERAKLTLNVTQLNQAGDTVGVQDYILNAQEREQRYKVIELSRTCVNYKVKMFVDRGTSEIPLWEEITPFCFPIRNADDWKEFRNRVQVAGGKYDVNARLYADFTTSECISWESSYAYRGNFDGNGHTITFNLADNAQPYSAPFRYVSNATFKNLHVAGTVNSTGQYAGGLIAYILDGSNNVTIENCRSSMTIKSTNFTNGGFIARLGDNSTVVIRNSKFDGAFEGAESHHNGGFIGYCQSKSKATIENCLFAPDHITTKLDQCQTWARGGDDITLSVVNSHATREYSAFVIIRNASDWTTFKDLVEAAKGQYWVDARLEADISLSGNKCIAGYTGNYPYRGTFDGNGHTITLDISDSAPRTGLFSHVSNATFRNLKLKGTVSASEMWEGSLIGQIDDASSVLIENCHSSVTVKNSREGDATMGGFVGYIAATNSNLTIRNCRFDGSFEGAKCHSNGGFVGWTNSPVTIENCLFDPASIKTRYDNCSTWARNGAEHLTVTNSHSTKEYNIFPISSSADWDTFCDMINIANAEYYIDAMLTNDISISTSAAYSKAWSGTFYGNGHTITVNINGGQNGCIALFCRTKNFTIKNLHLAGTLKGGPYLAGLVGETFGDYNHIENCRVSATLDYYSTSPDEYVGGFVGLGNDKPVVITNCLFDGSILGGNRLDYGSAFIGYQRNYGNSIQGNSFNNNLENGSSYPKETSGIGNTIVGMNYLPMDFLNVLFWANGQFGSNNWTYHAIEQRYDVNYAFGNVECWKEASQVGNKSASDMVTQLGSDNWIHGITAHFQQRIL